VQQGASAITSPVLEFVTGMYFFVFDSRHSLFTQYLNRLGAAIISLLSTGKLFCEGPKFNYFLYHYP